jgi:hypothetical protein
MHLQLLVVLLSLLLQHLPIPVVSPCSLILLLLQMACLQQRCRRRLCYVQQTLLLLLLPLLPRALPPRPHHPAAAAAPLCLPAHVLSLQSAAAPRSHPAPGLQPHLLLLLLLLLLLCCCRTIQTSAANQTGQIGRCPRCRCRCRCQIV